MKKTILIMLLIASSLPLFAQDKAALTKEETINYISKKLQETQDFDFKHDFKIIYNNDPEILSYQEKKMYILSNSIALNSKGTITHIGKIASSLSPCSEEKFYYGSLQSEVSFNPIHITKVEVVENDEPRVGRLKITFLANTEKWEKNKLVYKIAIKNTERVVSHYDYYTRLAVYRDKTTTSYDCDDTWTSTPIPNGTFTILFFKSDPENGKRLIKAFNHLIDIYKAEDDPFGQ